MVEGHCYSGLTAHRPPPPPEPMCGFMSTSLDAITIVAEASPKSHHSAESSSSLAGAESQVGGDSQTDAETKGTAESPSISKRCPDELRCLYSVSIAATEASERLHPAEDITYSQARSDVAFRESVTRFFIKRELDTRKPRGPPAIFL